MLSNNSTVPDELGNESTPEVDTSKIEFINELGFPVLIFKIQKETLEEQLVTEIENHGRVEALGMLGQEFIVRK